MKKSYKMLAMLFSLASLGIFLFLFGYLLFTTNEVSDISENQTSQYKYLFLKLTLKPKDLIAQVGDSEKKQQTEKAVDQVGYPGQGENKLTNQNDTLVVNEKNDSTLNNKSEEQWIQQVIQMNGCFDMQNDFIEKEWMKEHTFLIL